MRDLFQILLNFEIQFFRCFEIRVHVYHVHYGILAASSALEQL
jgi:hypothetical protein